MGGVGLGDMTDKLIEIICIEIYLCSAELNMIELQRNMDE